MCRRGMGPGDRYITAAEAGTLFNVSLSTANSAMCMLAERKLLVRRRNSGSFGGPELKSPVSVGGPTVYVLWRSGLPEGFENIHADEMIRPLRKAMGTPRNIQLCFLSEVRRLPNTLRVRTIPHDPIAVAAEVERLMAQPDRPTAVIAMFEQVGEITIDVASRMGLAVPDDVEVVFRARRPQAGKRPEHTQLQYAMSPFQFCEQAAAMLERLWRAVPLEQKRVVVPAELFERDSAYSDIPLDKELSHVREKGPCLHSH